METHLDIATIRFQPSRDRVEATAFTRDLRGGLIRHHLSAVAHPTWDLPRMARALARDAERRLDNPGFTA